RERQAPDVCHEELRPEGVAPGPLAGAPDGPRGEVGPGDPGPEVSQVLGQHARATADLEDRLAGQVEPQKLQPRPELLSDQILVEPAAGMRPADLELLVTRLVVVLLLAHSAHRPSPKLRTPSRPDPATPPRARQYNHSAGASQQESERRKVSAGGRAPEGEPERASPHG